MEDAKEQTQQHGEESVLVAYVTVHLESGESFEFLPFEDGNDVKSKVSDLLEDWSKSGFLVRGSRIYPWHTVKLIEATEVVELSKKESEQQIVEWKKQDLAHLQQSFWKTKQAREKKNNEGNKGNH